MADITDPDPIDNTKPFNRCPVCGLRISPFTTICESCVGMEARYGKLQRVM